MLQLVSYILEGLRSINSKVCTQALGRAKGGGGAGTASESRVAEVEGLRTQS